MAKATPQEILAALEEAEDAARQAVGHVGLANYAEREREAHKWVREAFEKVRKLVSKR